MADPTLAEHRRFCARCRAPVGRSSEGRPSRSRGFCGSCGAPFSFTPSLSVGDLVAGQYEVVGCLAHGGLGWIYLAKDHNVGDRWVVLKGVLNAGDEHAVAAALAERRFLAEVEHPNIVKILNFVERDGSGYIVMEYVGGASLKELLAARRQANGGEADPLPVTHAIAYILEILPALAYLHRRGLLFCDFKLDNVIQTEHSLKLIDLGGVYGIDDVSSPVYGTLGYRAPEIERVGPSVASDLFTVARTLALLCTDFDGYRSTHRFTLPPRQDSPAFAACGALYQLLLKATAPDPGDRFQSAEEMADQLFGVLREVVAAESGRPVPATSALFTEDFRGDSGAAWQLLPALRVAGDDPAAGYLATLAAADPTELINLLRAAPKRTVEVDLRLARALIDDQRWRELDELLRALARRHPADWRTSWYRGVAALAREHPAAAREHFAAVYRAVPGELGPKLALAVSAEHSGDPSEAARWYEAVSQTDGAYTTATLGLARCRLRCGDRSRAVAAFDRIPESSSAYIDAQVAKIDCLIGGEESAFGDLRTAAATLGSLTLDRMQRAALTADLLHAALDLIHRGALPADAPAILAGHELNERAVRLGLERTYRTLASMADTAHDRIRLVDRANRIRPRTWT